MRLIPVLTVAACLSVPGALFAQEWTEFASREDRFYIDGVPPPPVNSRGGQGGFGRINAPGAPAAQDGAAPPGGQPR